MVLMTTSSAMILSLLNNRAADTAVCQSEVARALTDESAGKEWRNTMPIAFPGAHFPAQWHSWRPDAR
jgi:hypothetical protein